MNIMCDIFKILHVSLNKKSPQKCKIGMNGIVNLDKSPWILSTPEFFALNL